jgi:hypothetical protein
MLPDEFLDWILTENQKIDHVEVIELAAECPWCCRIE